MLIHGTIVAVRAADGLWQMFFFGFAGIVMVTTMYGLKLPRWVRLTVLGAYLACAVAVYSQLGLANIYQITWIPLTYYATILVLALLLGAVIWLVQRVRTRRQPPATLSH